MIQEQKGNQTILKDSSDNFDAFFEVLSKQLTDFKAQNLIIDLSGNSKVTNSSIKQFVTISKLHKKNKKSFVIVANAIGFTSVPVSLTVVPTLLEANDIIEMEDIERDLGF
jgi:hypothetical protein